MLCICSALNSWRMGTTTAPYVRVARNVTAQWAELRPQMAILSFLYTAVLKEYVQFFNFSCHVMKLQCCSLIVGKGIGIPVVDNGIIY